MGEHHETRKSSREPCLAAGPVRSRPRKPEPRRKMSGDRHADKSSSSSRGRGSGRREINTNMCERSQPSSGTHASVFKRQKLVGWWTRGDPRRHLGKWRAEHEKTNQGKTSRTRSCVRETRRPVLRSDKEARHHGGGSSQGGERMGAEARRPALTRGSRPSSRECAEGSGVAKPQRKPKRREQKEERRKRRRGGGGEEEG